MRGADGQREGGETSARGAPSADQLRSQCIGRVRCMKLMKFPIAGGVRCMRFAAECCRGWGDATPHAAPLTGSPAWPGHHPLGRMPQSRGHGSQSSRCIKRMGWWRVVREQLGQVVRESCANGGGASHCEASGAGRACRVTPTPWPKGDQGGMCACCSADSSACRRSLERKQARVCNQRSLVRDAAGAVEPGPHTLNVCKVLL